MDVSIISSIERKIIFKIINIFVVMYPLICYTFPWGLKGMFRHRKVYFDDSFI